MCPSPVDAPPPPLCEDQDGARLRDLIERACQGERAATDALLAYYRPRLRRWAAYRLTGTPHDASSMTQELLTRMYRGLPELRGRSPGELEAWLSKALRHLIISAERGRTAQKRGGAELKGAIPLPGPDASPTPSQHLRERQGQRRLLQLISRLPGDQGPALWRRHIEGWTVAEIAEELGKTAPEVSSLLWRALVSLRAQVQDGEAVLPAEEERLSPEIDRAMAEYAERLDAGEVMDEAVREVFFAAHPACATVLRRLLAWADRVTAWSAESG